MRRYRASGSARISALVATGVAAVVALSTCFDAAAQSDDLQGDYDVEPDRPISLRALVDVRVVRAGRAPSWMDRGPGKTRYGGIDDDGSFERVTRFALANIALEPQAELPWGVLAHAQLSWEGNVDDRGNVGPDHDSPRLVEGWLRKEWSAPEQSWSVLVGVSNPSYSLEHIGPAWAPLYSLTPSALNTWLWEEGRVVGFEGEWWSDVGSAWELTVFGGAGWGPDQQGILLAQRGWVLSDWLAGVNSTLVLPAPGAVTHEFDERDGRPALYMGVDLRDPWKIGHLRAGYFDNLGDRAVEGVWETRYAVAGVSAEPLPGLDVLLQGLIGKTAVRNNWLDSTIAAFYPLVSYRWRNHRLTARYDDFNVSDSDDRPPQTRERGWAVTLAYLLQIGLRHQLAFEYIFVDSHRPGTSASDPSDDGWELSYRFRY